MSDELQWDELSIPDLEERAVLFFLEHYDIPGPPDIFDESGRIIPNAKTRPSYKGIVDAMLGRAYDQNDTSLAYGSGYNQGEFVRNKFKHELLVQGICDHSLN